MKIIIDTNVIKDNGLKVVDFLLLLSIKELSRMNYSIDKSLTFLKDNNLIISEKITSQSGIKFIDDILNKSSIKDVDEIESLAKQLQSLWPEGYKDKKYRWKSNSTDIKRRIEKFFRIYGKYTNEQIVEAAKKYVKKFNDSGNRTYQKLLKYFIFKEDGSDSELANMLESINNNENDDIIQSNEITLF